MDRHPLVDPPQSTGWPAEQRVLPRAWFLPGNGPAAGRDPPCRGTLERPRVAAERVPRPTPVPQNLTLAAVSCVTARFCMAVGDASRGAKAMPSPAYRDTTLTERWNGSRWRIIPAPSPAHASRLSGVSCPSPTACVAVGSSAGGGRTLAERWNGVRWTVQHTPGIGRTGYSALTAVSCATAANCMAVGTYNAGISGIAEHWDGKPVDDPAPAGPAWAARPGAPRPPGQRVVCVGHSLRDGGQQPGRDHGRALERRRLDHPADPGPRLTARPAHRRRRARCPRGARY